MGGGALLGARASGQGMVAVGAWMIVGHYQSLRIQDVGVCAFHPLPSAHQTLNRWSSLAYGQAAH